MLIIKILFVCFKKLFHIKCIEKDINLLILQASK